MWSLVTAGGSVVKLVGLGDQVVWVCVDSHTLGLCILLGAANIAGVAVATVVWWAVLVRVVGKGVVAHGVDNAVAGVERLLGRRLVGVPAVNWQVSSKEPVCRYYIGANVGDGKLYCCAATGGVGRVDTNLEVGIAVQVSGATTWVVGRCWLRRARWLGGCRGCCLSHGNSGAAGRGGNNSALCIHCGDGEANLYRLFTGVVWGNADRAGCAIKFKWGVAGNLLCSFAGERHIERDTGAALVRQAKGALGWCVAAAPVNGKGCARGRLGREREGNGLAGRCTAEYPANVTGNVTQQGREPKRELDNAPGAKEEDGDKAEHRHDPEDVVFKITHAGKLPLVRELVKSNKLWFYVRIHLTTAMKFIGFVFTFVVLFAISVVFLAAVDALPEPIGGYREPVAEVPIYQGPAQATTSPELPVRVTAPSIDMDVTILNTQSTNIAALDADLLKGAVRYPTSARLGEQGTVLLFGHSSYLPIVRNQNYKAFNGIQKLKEGEEIVVYSDAKQHHYTVTSVRLADAEEDVVELRTDGRYLTLVTCNTFAAKTARYVVTAELKEVVALN